MMEFIIEKNQYYRWGVACESSMSSLMHDTVTKGIFIRRATGSRTMLLNRQNNTYSIV